MSFGSAATGTWAANISLLVANIEGFAGCSHVGGIIADSRTVDRKGFDISFNCDELGTASRPGQF